MLRGPKPNPDSESNLETKLEHEATVHMTHSACDPEATLHVKHGI